MTPSIPILLYPWMDDGARCSADRCCTVSRASFEAHEDVMAGEVGATGRLSQSHLPKLASTPAVTIGAHAVRRRQLGTRLGSGA